MAPRIRHNATLATAARVQAVLESAGEPISRYEVFTRLRGAVNYPVIDSVLDFFSQLRLVVDEGKGGKARWVGPDQGAASASPARDRIRPLRHARIDASAIRRACRLSPSQSLRLAASLTDAALELSRTGGAGRARLWRPRPLASS